jgi:hypothetical protein
VESAPSSSTTTYYPGITNGLRDELNRRAVDTYLLVEDSQEMIRSYFREIGPDGNLVATVWLNTNRTIRSRA